MAFWVAEQGSSALAIARCGVQSVSCQLSPHQRPLTHSFMYSTDIACQALGIDSIPDGRHSCSQGACPRGGRGEGNSEINVEGNVPTGNTEIADGDPL